MICAIFLGVLTKFLWQFTEGNTFFSAQRFEKNIHEIFFSHTRNENVIFLFAQIGDGTVRMRSARANAAALEMDSGAQLSQVVVRI